MSNFENVDADEKFAGVVANRGGYDSKLEIDGSVQGLRVTLIADWLPQSVTPEVDLIDWNDEEGKWLVDWSDTGWNGPDGWFTSQEVADLLADLE